jgi:chromate reductase
LTPAPHTFDLADFSALPLYDPDVEAQGFPPAVGSLRAAVVAADALLFATPEYYRSIPGSLKNAIDWLGRPPGPPLARKPVAVLGASTIAFGTVQAQLHLRDILLSFDVQIAQRPEVYISTALAPLGLRARKALPGAISGPLLRGRTGALFELDGPRSLGKPAARRRRRQSSVSPRERSSTTRATCWTPPAVRRWKPS